MTDLIGCLAGLGLTATYELRLGDERFAARVDGDRLEIARGHVDNPDATIESDPGTLSAVIYDG